MAQDEKKRNVKRNLFPAVPPLHGPDSREEGEDQPNPTQGERWGYKKRKMCMYVYIRGDRTNITEKTAEVEERLERGDRERKRK